MMVRVTGGEVVRSFVSARTTFSLWPHWKACRRQKRTHNNINPSTSVARCTGSGHSGTAAIGDRDAARGTSAPASPSRCGGGVVWLGRGKSRRTRTPRDPMHQATALSLSPLHTTVI